MRACQPSGDGYVERDGVKVHYEVYGAGEPTVLLQPTWSIIHSRHWKMQIPYLARHSRVLTFDGRGNGRSDRPAEPEAYRRPSSPPTPWPSWTPPAPSGRCWSRCRSAPPGRWSSARCIPSGWRGSYSSPRRCRWG